MMTARITITAPISSKRPPGTNWDTVDPKVYPALSASAVLSWGTEPSEANITYAGASPIPLGAAVKLEVGKYFFAGICESDVPLTSARGNNRQLTIRDFRKWLDWDKTYCLFNRIDDSLNPVTNQRRRRFMHVLPVNHYALRYTWTDLPYSVADIMQFVLRGPGIETPWTVGYIDHAGTLTNNLYHPNMRCPVYELDCMGGKSVGTLMSELCDQVGLMFTLMPSDALPFNLVFAMRGVDGPDVVLPATSNNREAGMALSGNATRVRILGDRNLYQVHDISLVPDWNPQWNQFYDVNLFVDYCFKHFVTWDKVNDPDQIIARQEALSLATEMSVGAFAERAAALGAGDFLDSRKYGGRSRNYMPAALYIHNVLFRCFRLPDNFGITNTYGQKLHADSLEIQDKLISNVWHDPINGLTSYSVNECVDGNAYVIVKGYQVGKDMFESIRPERFDITQWTSSQNIWQKIDVRIEHAGGPGAAGASIVFDEPVIQTSSEDGKELVKLIDGFAVFSARPTITVPPVRAALTFAGEKFSWYQWEQVDPAAPPEDPVMGLQEHDEVLNISGLNGEFVAYPGSKLFEIWYADDKTCRTKAIEFGNNFLKFQPTHAKGKFTVPLDEVSSYQLHGKIDRVSFSYSPQGHQVTVELTNERSKINFVPERDLDRMRQLRTLLPGQAELRKQSESARKIASAVRSSKDAYKMLSEAFHGNFMEAGNAKPVVITPFHRPDDPDGVDSRVPVGCVFVKQPSARDNTGKFLQTRARLLESLKPMETADRDKYSEFAGLSTKNLEPIDAKNGSVIRLQSTGKALAQVLGPVKVGDLVGFKRSGATMEVSILCGNPDTSVGVAEQEIKTVTVQLIRVNLGTGGSSVRKYRVKAHKGDYLVCRTWDAKNKIEGTIDYNIAKPLDLRYSLTKETIDGVEITYSDWDETAQKRKASDGTNTDDEVIVPRYLTEGAAPTVITAQVAEGGTGVTVGGVTVDGVTTGGIVLTLEQVPCGREWARKYVPPTT